MARATRVSAAKISANKEKATSYLGAGIIGDILKALGVSAKSISPDAASGTLVASILNLLSGSALSIVLGGSFVAVSGSSIVKGVRSFRPGYHNVTFRETKGSNTKDTTLTLKAPRTSVLVEDFEDLSTGWANATAAPAIVAANPNWFMTGKQSMRLAQVDGATGSVRNIKSLATPIPMDATTNIDFACFPEDLAKTSSVGITLTNDANQGVTFTFDNLARGPQRLTANIGKASAAFLLNNGVPAKITKIQCTVFSWSQGGGAASFDDFRVGPKAIPNGMMQVDDGYAEQFTVYKPIWEAAGIKGWLNLESDRIGVSGAMTLAQLQQWVADGHYVGNHGDGTPLTDLSQADAEANLQACMDVIRSNGLSRDTTWDGRKCKGSEFHLAYPNGVNNAAVDAAMRAKGILTGSTTLPKGVGTKNGLLSPFGVPRIGMTSRTSAAIIADIQACLDHGRDFIVFAHTTSGTSATVMQEVVNFLKAQWDVGNLFMTNLLDWYDALPQAPLPFRGFSLAGGEFGGKADNSDRRNYDYVWPTLDEGTYYSDKGANLFRLPYRRSHFWNADGSVRTEDVNLVRAFIQAQNARGVVVELDRHEYYYKFNNGHPANAAAYQAVASNFYQDTDADRAQFQEEWRKDADLFKDLNVRYLVMNEPTAYSGAPNVAAVWKLNQAGLNGIRQVDTVHKVKFCGWGYSSAQTWVSSGNAAGFLTLVDPAGAGFSLLIPEVHQYLDDGGYIDSHPGKEANPVIVGFADMQTVYVNASSPHNGQTLPPALKAFTEWARANGIKGSLGEFAVKADRVYLNEGARQLRNVHENRDVWESWIYWGGGPWWSYYKPSDPTVVLKEFSPEPIDRSGGDTLHIPILNMLSQFMPIGA